MEIPSPSSQPSKGLDRVRAKLGVMHESTRTEEIYVGRIVAQSSFLESDMGAPEIEAFLTTLAFEGQVAASTRDQARAARLFLHQHF